MIKAWIADQLWSALLMFSDRLVKWLLSPERAKAARFRDRERWYAYSQKAQDTPGGRDDLLAEFLRIRFAFETPPAEAIERGDVAGLKQIEEKAVQKYLDTAAWDGPASDRRIP